MSCDICRELERLSFETWERIKFARTRRGLRIYETTLTQNILFSLRRFQERCTDYSLSLDEAIDERTNGNDIELIVQTSSGYVKLPTQAKLLYSNLKYTAISHPGSTGYQVDDLINYASSIGGIPMYLLYNYVPRHNALRDHGCTMLQADYIRNHFSPHRSPTVTRWHIPTFNDLHLPALPWHQVLCNLLNEEDIIPYLREMGQDLNIDEMQFYTREELESDEGWQELEAIPSIDGFEMDEEWQDFEKISQSIEYYEVNEIEIFTEEPIREYNPRFRVIISTGEDV